ncbi:2926_t:CDS:2 [Rhizophagus irregularis]|nr:2926_t:CDS:2 [Rhizophagus irregularis]
MQYRADNSPITGRSNILWRDFWTVMTLTVKDFWMVYISDSTLG